MQLNAVAPPISRSFCACLRQRFQNSLTVALIGPQTSSGHPSDLFRFVRTPAMPDMRDQCTIVSQPSLIKFKYRSGGGKTLHKFEIRRGHKCLRDNLPAIISCDLHIRGPIFKLNFAQCFEIPRCDVKQHSMHFIRTSIGQCTRIQWLNISHATFVVERQPPTHKSSSHLVQRFNFPLGPELPRVDVRSKTKIPNLVGRWATYPNQKKKYIYIYINIDRHQQSQSSKEV